MSARRDDMTWQQNEDEMIKIERLNGMECAENLIIFITVLSSIRRGWLETLLNSNIVRLQLKWWKVSILWQFQVFFIYFHPFSSLPLVGDKKREILIKRNSSILSTTMSSYENR